MPGFEINEELVAQIQLWIEQKDDRKLKHRLKNVHYADVAEIIENLPQKEATYLFKLIESKDSADALVEIDEDTRNEILAKLSAQEIAKAVEELDTDDATDVIGELPKARRAKVMSEILDGKHLSDIKELLKYEEDTAGAHMAKELVKVHRNVDAIKCMEEMRAMASDVKKVHSIYVVDDYNKLLGRLSLKDLITANDHEKVNDIYIPKVAVVTDDQPIEEVARYNEKI